MRARKRNLIDTVAVLTIVLSFYAAACAQTTYSVLHSFGSGTDGGGPSGSVALDSKGRVYSATSGGWALRMGHPISSEAQS